MEQISFKVENFVVTISGIGAKDKGSITITDSTQRTRSLELTELCLERGKATGQEKASARVEESKRGLQRLLFHRASRTGRHPGYSIGFGQRPNPQSVPTRSC